MHALPHSVPSTPQQATTDSRLHQRLLDTHRQVWVSFLWGHCSFLLGPGAHKILFVPSKSLFPQSCVSSSGSMVGTSSKRAYAIPSLLHPESLQQATADPNLHRRHSDTVLAHRTGSHSSVGWVCVLGPSRSEQLWQPGAWQTHCPRWAMHLNHLLVPAKRCLH